MEDGTLKRKKRVGIIMKKTIFSLLILLIYSLSSEAIETSSYKYVCQIKNQTLWNYYKIEISQKINRKIEEKKQPFVKQIPYQKDNGIYNSKKYLNNNNILRDNILYDPKNPIKENFGISDSFSNLSDKEYNQASSIWRELKNTDFRNESYDSNYDYLKDNWKYGYILYDKTEINYSLNTYSVKKHTDFFVFNAPASALTNVKNEELFSEASPWHDINLTSDTKELAMLSEMMSRWKYIKSLKEKRRLSENIGTLGRELSLPVDYPGAILLFEGKGSGQFDSVYWCCKETNYNFYIVAEDKGGRSKLGFRKIEEIYVQQGHPAYVKKIADVMIDKISRGVVNNLSFKENQYVPEKDLLSVFKRIYDDIDIGNIEIVLYKTPIPTEINIDKIKVRSKLFSAFPNQGYLRSLHKDVAEKIRASYLN